MKLDESLLIAATDDHSSCDFNVKKQQLNADSHILSKTYCCTQFSIQDSIDDTLNYDFRFTLSQQWRQELIISMKHLKLIKKSENMNLDKSWWQYKFILHALETVASVITDDESEINITSIKSSFFKHKDKKFDQKSTHFEILAETAKKINIYNSIDYLNTDTIIWNKKLKTSDLSNQDANDSVFLIKIISDSLKIFNDQQSWFNKIKYQHKNHLKICKILNIENLNISKLFKIRLSTAFHFWQFMMIKAFMKFSKNTLLWEIILIDVVDLNKTWTSIDYLMTVSLSI